MREVLDLLKMSQSADKHAEIELINRYEGLINKLSWHNGVFSEDCKQQLTIEFIMAVSRFDIKRYIDK
ncbi:helix-turn-helix domain-containing protein [Paenibacillus monticola]|uniref:Helix-turn-helix domain-containing protein n=1 Tax=Paenibacillus monticola TaxID=2666075 RepID=A0A7X2H5C8_9BACL|nr:helix-turn-helix domain-containing protein [Paenibacillus monticola]MRN53832.1 helix-turn-helix domain-containing protein [Paenibacillus monticola]